MEGKVLVLSNCALQRAAVQHIYESAGYISYQSVDSQPHMAIEKYKPDVIVIAPSNESPSPAPLCQQIRAVSSVPVIVSPQIHDDFEEMNLLAAGADDYISRERNHRVLTLRTGALLNRFKDRNRNRKSDIQIGKLTLNLDARVADYAGQYIPLTRTEFDLLAILMRNTHRVVHREELLNKVWGAWYGDDHLLEVHISRLRKKVLAVSGPKICHPVRGVGYRLTSYGQSLD
jgi:DNA-binding response OmpR family regulator